MHAFLHVARERSFTRAADKLDISRAMVSKHIARLEDELGTRLFNRSTHGISITESGQAYRARCAQILADIEELEAEVGAFDQTPRGVVRIGAPPTLGTFHIAPAVADYIELYPHIRVDLVMSERPPDPIEQGLELTIWLGDPPDSNYILRRLASTRYVACAAPDYIARHGRPDSPGSLAEHNCLRHSATGVAADWVFDANGESLSVKVHGNFKASLANAIRHVAVRGLGIAYLPTYIVGNDINAGRLEQLLPAYAPAPVPIYAIYPHRRHLSAKVRTFLDFVSERLDATITHVSDQPGAAPGVRQTAGGK
ncbi:MAG: LysR family transcriptional regulator [Gammaproteobacteria bacterium]|nr:LysR family transcriptional regulator [Gammaproteobacteria bacterium]